MINLHLYVSAKEISILVAFPNGVYQLLHGRHQIWQAIHVGSGLGGRMIHQLASLHLQYVPMITLEK